MATKKEIMKALQTLTTCLLLLISLTTTAQEKQNDATWEETMEFLGENIDKFNGTQRFKIIDGNELDNEEYKISNKIVDGVLERHDASRKISASLENLSSADISRTIYGCECIRLKFTKNSVTDEHPTFGESLGSTSFISLDHRLELYRENKEQSFEKKCISQYWSSEDEFVQRMLKAFKHLAYLANEKRSKSKF